MMKKQNNFSTVGALFLGFSLVGQTSANAAEAGHHYFCQFQKALYGPGPIEEIERRAANLLLEPSQRIGAELNGYKMQVNTCNEDPANEIDVSITSPEGVSVQTVTHAGVRTFDLYQEVRPAAEQRLELSISCELL